MGLLSVASHKRPPLCALSNCRIIVLRMANSPAKRNSNKRRHYVVYISRMRDSNKHLCTIPISSSATRILHDKNFPRQELGPIFNIPETPRPTGVLSPHNSPLPTTGLSPHDLHNYSPIQRHPCRSAATRSMCWRVSLSSLVGLNGKHFWLFFGFDWWRSQRSPRYGFCHRMKRATVSIPHVCEEDTTWTMLDVDDKDPGNMFMVFSGSSCCVPSMHADSTTTYN